MSRLRNALNKKLPNWLDRPLEACCVGSALLGLIPSLVWLIARLIQWMR